MPTRKVRSLNVVSIENSIGATQRGEVARTTLVLPITLDQNLEGYALQCGKAKNELIKTAVTEYLASKGLDPARKPKFEISYAD